MALPNPPSIATQPPAAATAGCGAVATVASSWTDGTNWIQHYTLTATSGQGWRFEKFTYDLIEKDQTGAVIWSQTGVTKTANPETSDDEFYALLDDDPIESVERRIYNLTAHFVQDTPTLFTITTAVSPAGAGTTTGDGTYAAGTTATIVATPNNGFMFLRWEKNGATVSTSKSYSFTVMSTATYTAVFRAFTNLLVNSANLGSPVQLVYDPATNKLVADF